MRTVVASILTIALATGVIGMVGLKPLVDVVLRGTVDVGSLPRAYTIDLAIREPEGTLTRPLGSLSLPATCLVVKTEHAGYSGNLTLIISGKLVIMSPNSTYAISMPCMLAIGEPCYRVMALIPGYDVPLCVEPGDYSLELTLTWRASGRGSFTARLALYETYGRCRTD